MIKFLITLFCLSILCIQLPAQDSTLFNVADTVHVTERAHAIIKSWYPEYKEFPSLKVGKRKLIFTTIPQFKNLSIRDNHINLICSDSTVIIKEIENKPNQYLVTVNSNDKTNVTFELWYSLENKVVLLKQNSQWINLKEIYETKGDRILIDTITLKMIK